MEEKRPLFAGRIALSFVIATIIFIGAFLIGYMISYSKYQSVSLAQEEIRYNFLNLEIEKQLISSSCDLFDVSSFSEELQNMGSIIGILEERFGKRDDKVSSQKKVYSMLEIQHFLLIKQYKEDCDLNVPIILFFYSNQEDFIEQAEKMGYILSSLKTENPEIMIYSFDYDLDYNLINILKTKYDIKQPNSVTVDEKMILTNFNSIDEVKEIVFQNSSSEVILLG